MLCKFDEMHQAAEFLMGHPIWTHHFALKSLWEEMQKTIAEQCPGLPTDASGITKDNWPEFKAKLEGEFGETVKIRKGGGLTAMLPTDGIPDHLKDRTITRSSNRHRERDVSWHEPPDKGDWMIGTMIVVPIIIIIFALCVI